MKVLVTAGSTAVRIDQVRVISNIFKGKTGHAITQYFHEQGENVTLLTSNKEIDTASSKLIHYKFYDELYENMERLIKNEKFDLIIHSAAVSDYKPAGVFVLKPNLISHELVEIDSSTKVGSEHDALYLKMVPTRKIIDDIRTLWNYKECLVKFKLQVGMSDEELIEIATKSMKHSEADMIVANCLEWSRDRAYIIEELIDREVRVTDVERQDLAKEIYDRVK